MFAPAGARPNAVLDVSFAQRTDTGRMRENDEDYLGHAAPATPSRARSHGWLFALADGVGGQERGEVASREAVEEILAGFRAAPASEPPAALLSRLTQAANLHVYELGKNAAPGGVSMATTIVACLLRHDRVTVAHAGDSRCYLIRKGRAEVLTRDHTISREQMNLGVISAKEEAESPSRHLLTRSLGTGLFVNVEIADSAIEAGDVLALCCDGLHNSVTGQDMADALAGEAPLEEAAAKLVDLANQRDGSDNISVQLIRVRSVERVGMYRGRPYKLR
ncbi:MAG TPA: protein phosphatase 2C domain-containing protein [Bryobacteraceae bacterium]|nr:protein phosphatase 2C domain-containing protein [Bryobacteraceae bacterium]